MGNLEALSSLSGFLIFSLRSIPQEYKSTFVRSCFFTTLKLYFKEYPMFKKLTFLTVITATSLLASAAIIPNLNKELVHNQALIKEYKEALSNLEKRNDFLLEQKNKNPELYEVKPLFEDTKEAYINRIKLNGASPKNINFTIKNHTLTLEMQMKTERKDKNGYFSSSQYFFQSYPIPKDVNEEKIKYSVDGDYYVINMPKK